VVLSKASFGNDQPSRGDPVIPSKPRQLQPPTPVPDGRPIHRIAAAARGYPRVACRDLASEAA
jgi:hypothetical protein